MAAPSVRLLRDDERVAAAKVVNYGMLGSLDEEVNRRWAEIMPADRSHGAFSASDELVGLARWFPSDLRVPGGGLPAACVTAVAVLSNHRRQGHLTRLMHAELKSIAEEDVPVAVLIAAEWPIYGRFGYGPAVDACGFEIDTAMARFRVPATGSIEMVDAAGLRPEIESAHDARWARTPGAVRREPEVWDIVAGVTKRPGSKEDAGQRRGALWRDDEGAVQGAVAYKVDDTWNRNRPAAKAEVDLLVGATPEAERELWRHLCEIDWVRTVTAGPRGVDDPLPFFLVDGRAATAVDHFDCVWARILDVPAALGGRRATLAGTAVVEVTDPLGHAGGRWRLDLGPDGSEVAPSGAAADVNLPIGALSAAYLGGRSVRRLHEAGWVDEGTPGGVDRLDALLSTPTAPWSPTTF